MKTFTVHVPDGVPAASHDRVRFVRDGFYFWALVFGPLWIAFHRLWLVLVAYIVAIAAIEVAMFALGISGSAGLWVSLCLGILLGLEGGTLRRWTLSRRGYRQVAIVIARDAAEAEHRYFHGLTEAPARFAPAHGAAALPGAPDVIGSFPHPQGAAR